MDVLFCFRSNIIVLMLESRKIKVYNPECKMFGQHHHIMVFNTRVATEGAGDVGEATRDGMVPQALTTFMREMGAEGEHGTDTVIACITAQCQAVRWGEVARKRWVAEHMECIGLCLRGAGGSRRAETVQECSACGEPVTRMFRITGEAGEIGEGVLATVAKRQMEKAQVQEEIK